MSRAPAARAELEEVFRAALQAVDAGAALDRALGGGAGGLSLAGERLAPGVRLRVVAAGKAAAPMAAALEARAGERIAAGLAVVPDGHGLPLARIRLREAAHPVPDARSERAAREALSLVSEAPPEDALVVLLSGGASSLLSAPAPGLARADLAAATRALLAAGCGIDELNSVRKHLGLVSGGRLAAASRTARIHLLAVSDVPGGRFDVIGSGPCSPDPTRYADALDVIARRQLRGRLPPALVAHLEAGARGEREETPKPGDPRLARVRSALVADNGAAREAALAAARSRGRLALPLGEILTGEASRAGCRLAALAAALRPPRAALLVAGGETVVRVCGAGRGGRSQELALAAALELEGRGGVALLAAGTDGRDGPTDAAGAYADGDTVARGRARGLDARRHLAENDSYPFFAAEGGLFRTGPTRTNVMDLALVLLAPPC